MLHIRNVAKVLKSNEEGEDEVATLTVKYFTANQDAANSYVKVNKNCCNCYTCVILDIQSNQPA